MLELTVQYDCVVGKQSATDGMYQLCPLPTINITPGSSATQTEHMRSDIDRLFHGRRGTSSSTTMIACCAF